MSAHTIPTTTTPAAYAASVHARRLAQLGLAVVLLALCADLAVLYTQCVHGGAYATKGFYESDWLRFYQAAERVREGGNAYTMAGEFRNPPTFLLIARAALVLPYMPSRIFWSLLSTAMLLAAGAFTAAAMHWRPMRSTGLILAVYVLLYTPSVLLIPLAGNTTAPIVLSYALALWLFIRGQDGWAGAALCLAFLIKPQLLFLALPLLLYHRRWRALGAAGATAAVALALTVLVVGWHTFGDFYQMERSTASGANNIDIWIRDNPSIHAMFQQFAPHSAAAEIVAYGLSAALVAAIAWFWKGPWQPGSLRFRVGWAMIPIANLLVAPYAHSDDLVLLIVPAVVLYAAREHCKTRSLPAARWILPVLTALYLGPILVVFLRQHFMVPAMLAALYLLWQLAGEDVECQSELRQPEQHSGMLPTEATKREQAH